MRTALCFLAVVILAGCTPKPQVPPPGPAKPEASEPSSPAQPQAAIPADSSAPDESAVLATDVAPADDLGPQARTAFYRADANVPASIPPVVLSKGHQALCRVKVGDTMPAIELAQVGDGRKKLANLFGQTATVVVFWQGNRRMALEELADLGPDVVAPFGPEGVAVVGIAVNESAASAQAALQKSGAKFPNLLDADGTVFGQVGSKKLPRTYLVDSQGKILWFDIEYSQATRRELHQALRAVTGEPGQPASGGGKQE